jgi:hypothetical protein
MTNNRGTNTLSLLLQFHIGSVKLNWQIVPGSESPLFAGTWFWNITMENIPLGNAWKLVRRFLSVIPTDEDSVLQFVIDHGMFKAPRGSTKHHRLEASQLPVRRVWQEDVEATVKPVEMIMESFSLKEFATIQDYVRRVLTTGNLTLPTPWEPEDIERYEIAFHDSKAHVIVNRTFPAILATVQFKLAQGARFRTCARKDCRLPFEITSQHKRRFCTQYCAHLTSLRRRRKAKANVGRSAKIDNNQLDWRGQ